jgi:predicted permease
VARQGFFGVDVGQTFDVAVPIGNEPLVAGNNSGLDLRGRTWLTVMARLRAGREIDATSAELRSLHREIRESMPPTDPALGPLPQDLESPFSLVPAATGQSPLRGRYQQALLMLLVVSVTVLLIACINIANLLVARAIVRRREMSLRMALGAPRMRLARLMLVEAVMLSGAGAVLGMALAQWMSRFLVSRISTPASTVFFDLTPDWRVWGFAAGSSLATAAIFGVAPAWQSMRADPVDALKEQGRGTTGARRSWLSPALVSAQIALSLVLVVAAGLFVRTSAELAQRHVGGTRDRVLLVNVAAPMTRYALEQLVGTYDRVLQAISTVPGVERAAISDITPAGGSARTNFVEIPSGDTLPDRERLISINVISPGWLQTYGVRLESGRDFSVSDGPQSRAVALVNRAFVRRFFSGVNAVGQVISVGLPGRMTSVEIVGVVEDTVYRSLREPPSPTLFTSTTQRAAARPYVNVAVLAAAGSPAGLSRSIAAAVGSVDPDLVLQFRPLADQVTGAMSQERIVALLSSFFGGLALLLAGLGLYGLTAYNIGQQRSEIAMRIALGAGVVAVMRLVMRRAALLMASGVACGALLSLWASRFVEALVYGLQPRDPATFALAALVLTMVTALATAIPAWRASRIDPVEVLKEI